VPIHLPRERCTWSRDGYGRKSFQRRLLIRNSITPIISLLELGSSDIHAMRSAIQYPREITSMTSCITKPPIRHLQLIRRHDPPITNSSLEAPVWPSSSVLQDSLTLSVSTSKAVTASSISVLFHLSRYSRTSLPSSTSNHVSIPLALTCKMMSFAQGSYLKEMSNPASERETPSSDRTHMYSRYSRVSEVPNPVRMHTILLDTEGASTQIVECDRSFNIKSKTSCICRRWTKSVGRTYSKASIRSSRLSLCACSCTIVSNDIRLGPFAMKYANVMRSNISQLVYGIPYRPLPTTSVANSVHSSPSLSSWERSQRSLTSINKEGLPRPDGMTSLMTLKSHR